MIEILEDAGSDLVAVRIRDEVSKDEFVKQVTARAAVSGAHNAPVCFLLIIDTTPARMEKGAWMEDFFSQLKKQYNWEKVVIVCRTEDENWFSEVIAYFNTAKYKVFDMDRLPLAMEWLKNRNK